MSWLSRALLTGFKSDAKVVAVVSLRGMLAPPARGPRKLLNAERAQPWLDRAFSKSLNADAIALSVSSPGGSPAATEALVAAVRERAAERQNVPVWAFATDVAASGGYWLLSAAADECFALETSIVGSVGVVAPTFGAVDALKKIGIERRLMKAGSSKAGSDPFSPLTEAEKERTQSILDDLHATFIETVEGARGAKIKEATAKLLSSSSSSSSSGVPSKSNNDEDDDEETNRRRRHLAALVPDIFTGRVFTGRQAAALGLVDGIGGLREICRKKLSSGGGDEGDGKKKGSGGNVVFVDCGERVPVGGGFGLFSSSMGSFSSSISEIPARVMDSLEERAAYARFGL